MGASRETFDAFWHLTSKYGSPKRVFTVSFWKSEYAFHDTFGMRWNRLIGCRKKHKHVQETRDHYSEPSRLYCFACHREVK